MLRLRGHDGQRHLGLRVHHRIRRLTVGVLLLRLAISMIVAIFMSMAMRRVIMQMMMILVMLVV